MTRPLALVALVIGACGHAPPAAPDGRGDDNPDAASADAAIVDAPPTGGTPAPAGGWPVSSRCGVPGPGGCDVVEAETWDRTGVARLVRDPDTSLVHLFDPEGAVVVEIEPGAWFQPSGLTALPAGGWVFAGAGIGTGALRVGDDLVAMPNAYNRVIARIDSAGAVGWVQVIAGASAERAWIAARTDGSVAVTGEQMIDTTLGAFALAGPVWVFDFFAAALTADGAWAWAIELPSPADPLGDFAVERLALGPLSETIAPGTLRGTLGVAGDTVTGPVQAEAVASEAGVWLGLAPTQ